MHKLIATYLDRPHLVAAAGWLHFLVEVLQTWLASGELLTWRTFVSALVAALLTKRFGDATPKQVAAKVDVARADAAVAGYAEGRRVSSAPPPPMPPWIEPSYPELDLPLEDTPIPPIRGGQQ